MGSAGLIFTANTNGTGIFEIANNNNTFTGPISINGGSVRFASNGSFGNNANPIILDGGKLLSKSTYSILHPIQLGKSFGTGIYVAPTDTLTIDNLGKIITDHSPDGDADACVEDLAAVAIIRDLAGNDD